MRRVILFLVAPLFLFATYLWMGNKNYIISSLIPIKTLCKPGGASITFGGENGAQLIYYTGYGWREINIGKGQLVYNGVLYNTSFSLLEGTLNTDCVSKNFKLLATNPKTHAKFYTNYTNFCINKPGYTYSSIENAWIPNSNENGNIICPDEQVWDSKNNKCVNLPPCNLKCTSAGQVLDKYNCVCKCPPPLITSGSSCAPNPNINKTECEKEGGIYLDSVSPTQLFSDPKYAYLVMKVPLFTSHLCYTQKYVNAALAKIKNALSPEHVLLGALSFLPIGKLKYIFRADDLVQTIEKVAKSPKTLVENRPIIETRYNPSTGTYEPVVDLKPREVPLPEPKLLQAPDNAQEAASLVGTSTNLKDFLNSPFASADLQTPADFTQAAVEYDIDNNLRAGTQTKIADDLREIFNRSKPQQEENFPIALHDDVGDGQVINAEVKREITPVKPTTTASTSNAKAPTTYNTYNVTYYITPQGATTPAKITYKVTQTPATNSSPAKVTAVPTYYLGERKVVGTEIVIKKNSQPAKKTPASSKNTPKPKQQQINYNSFLSSAEHAITNAFNYKINLFTCPKVQPQCPNAITIHYNVMNVQGEYKIPDPMCAVISALNEPQIAPKINIAANLIVLFAGVMGALTLFRRD